MSRATRRCAAAPHATALLVTLAIATTLGVLGCEGDRRPENVLLVSIDSLRADRLGAYGNPRPTSPTLDRLAREGVLFERAYSPTSWTLPSHVTLLTGRMPHGHGTIAWQDTIAPDQPLLQERFASRGAETFGLFSGPLLHPWYGFGRGFDAYESCMSYAGPHSPEAGSRAVSESHADVTNPAIERAFGAWLARRAGRPFFAFVHMWDVHHDYIAPEPYASMFDPGYAGPLDGRDILQDGFPKNASARDVEHLLALYDAEIRYTDDTLGRMLAALDAAGTLEQTLVVVTADHGEEFHEHGGKTHHRTVYTESVHVPLIVWGAGRGMGGGRRVAMPVSIADIAPTITELLGLDALPHLDGRSLVPALRGEAMSPRTVESALHLPGHEWRRMLALRDPDRTLVLWRRLNSFEGFDPRADPGERRPTKLASGPERGALEAHDARLVAQLVARADATPAFVAAEHRAARRLDGAAGGAAPSDLVSARPGMPVKPPPAAAARPPSDVVRRLDALGYIE